MSQSLTAWVALVFVLSLMALLAIWSRRPNRARGLSVCAILVAIPVAASALMYALGWPVPIVNGLNAPAGQWTVIGQKMIVGQGIYILLDVPESEPRYFRLPWSAERAKELQDMLNKEQTPMMKVPPFEFSWDQHKHSFHPMPQPKWMPDKPRRHTPPKRYERGA